jgi:Lipoxygenase
MLTGRRFGLYRKVMAGFLSRGFADHPIEPLAQPVDATIDHVAHDELWPDLPLPGVRVAASFIPSDHAERRRLKIRVQMRLRGLLVDLAPKDAPPVPTEERAFLDAVYPREFDKAGVRRPVLPPELRGPEADVIAQVAVRGPFGSFLRSATADEVEAGEAAEDDYVVDLSRYLDHPAYDGLVRPGGKAVLSASPEGLTTRTVLRRDDVSQPLARRALLAAMNEDMTTFRHNLGVHNVVLTDVAIATINELMARHPVRRLLQHTFHTLLIGNLENCNAHFAGAKSFAVTLFSHDAEQVAALAAAHLSDFDLHDFTPDTQFERRGTTETPFPYPYRDNVLELWAANLDYVRDYLALYYADDAAVRADADLARWADALDALLPNPVTRPGDGLTREWLARICATVIHLSTVEHDILNNVVWDYGTFGFAVPAVVPADGAPMDQLRALDMLAILFVTWRPFNMLFESHIESMALDGAGRRVMLGWLDRLREIQEKMEARGHDPSLAYPLNFNISVTN